ncbi:capsule assembly Wzi family protein [Hymenobacter setariae]|uniref:Capsule assembly Wzi family protein n=1 Tax=Hymenobacter setariae TaxID=2594794 RepID=A0A558BN55_9BACT|nr:capsule assembly Wzi family protein [Hymenobacter setariae]TVT37944.1 capsule assembly Wzi family protein [Hymenobacter setariae]
MKHYLLPLLLVLAGPLAAQTTPTSAPPATGPGSANWYIFNQPLPESEAAKVTTKANQPATAPAPRRVRRAAAPSADYQGALYVPLDPNTYRLLDRYAIKYGSDSLRDPHTSVRPYTRAAAAHLGERILGGDSLTYSQGTLSRADRFNAQYLLKDNWMYSALGDSLNESQRPVLTYFYRDQTDLYHVQTKDFSLRVNPVLLLQGGKDNGTSSIDGLRYVNTRGIAFEGTIDQRLGFYGFLTDNQQAVPGWVQQRTRRDRIVPHEGYWKDFKTVGGSAYDFFTARGGITYAATKHINVQLAHDRNFIGNGYRSLILSDYSSPYFFLKLNTRVWKFNYQNIFAELTAGRTYNDAGSPTDSLFPKKYLALHHLSLDITDNFNIGVFESEVSGGPGRGLELQYLNPVIFYRAIEQQVGSTDNALLGLDFKWNIKHRAQLYGQLVFDEFKLSEIRAGNGWWANKQAFQLGGKLLDIAGVRNLDLQLEFNYIRPFTYQHESQYTNYQHYQQPLAHPMGANVSEVLGIVSYQPLPRLNLVAKAFYSVQGLDAQAPSATSNYGSNVLLSYNTRPMEYGYRIGTGDKNRLLHADFTATYQPRLNLFLDATLIARHQTVAQPTYYGTVSGNEVYASVAVRWNIAQRLHEF